MPIDRKGAPLGSGFDALGSPAPMGVDIAPRAFPKVRETAVMEASPNFGLPSRIEALDGCLKATLPRRGKHRCDPESQAGSNDSADHITTMVSALEDRVIVELGIARQSELLPMLQSRLYTELSRHEGMRPATDQPTVERDDVEDFNPQPALNRQSLNDVEAVQFGALMGHIGQVPTQRRWRMTNTASRVESPTSLQDSSDGSNRRDSTVTLSDELLADGPSSEFTQDAVFFQFLSKPQHSLLSRRVRAPGSVRRARSVTPVDAVQPMTACPLNPQLNRAETHSDLSGNRPHRNSSSDSLYHLASLTLARWFLLISPPLPFLTDPTVTGMH